jgi:hypothetical protein
VSPESESSSDARVGIRPVFACPPGDSAGSIECIERRAGPQRDVAGQLALGKFVFVYVELKRRSRLRNSGVLLLPLTRGRLRHAPIGPGEIGCNRSNGRTGPSGSNNKLHRPRLAIRRVSSPAPNIRAGDSSRTQPTLLRVPNARLCPQHSHHLANLSPSISPLPLGGFSFRAPTCSRWLRAAVETWNKAKCVLRPGFETPG